MVAEDPGTRASVGRLLEERYRVEAVARRAVRAGGHRAERARAGADRREDAAAGRARPPARAPLAGRARAGSPSSCCRRDDEEEWRIEGLRAGADDHLTDPFCARELLARVDVAPDEGAPARGGGPARARARRARGEAAGRPLRASEERFRTFVRRSRDGIIIIDGQGTILEWNEGEEEITGIPRSEAVTRPIWEVQHRLAPEGSRTAEHLRAAREKVLAALKEGVELKRAIEEEIQRPDGTRADHRVEPLRHPERRGAARVRDHSRRHRAQAPRGGPARAGGLARRSRAPRPPRPLGAGPAHRPVLLVGRGLSNPRASPKESTSPGPGALLEAVAPEDRERIAEALPRRCATGSRAGPSSGSSRRSAGVRSLHASVELLRDPGGAPARLIGTIQDVTERKQAEEALRRSQEDLRHAQAVAHVGSWRINVAGQRARVVRGDLPDVRRSRRARP